MNPAVFDSRGNLLHLGTKIGHGGEGDVFSIAGRDDVAAKIYKHTPDEAKQSKIRNMVQCGDPKLLNFTAWPLDYLSDNKNGKIIGFLMPKIAGMTPLHEVYSPAHRRQEHPEWGWNFLVYVARNLAAAFNSVHEHGHVIGDVNQGNAFVSNKSKVVLIDCDSYQTDFHGKKHLCEVGVAHFTPPELQGISSFKGVVRTPNHDNFGLALLIFHILYGGRHPYAGVPQANGIGDSLEDNIKNLRFAYSPSASKRLVLPPPKAIPLSIVPSEMARMFDIAFTEAGRNGARPTAKQWVDCLDHVKDSLRTCSTNAKHVYFKDLGSCPWCNLENAGVIYFTALTPSAGPGTVFTGDINKLWAAIQALHLPQSIQFPGAPSKKLEPTPLPAAIKEQGGKGGEYLLVFVGFLLATGFIPQGIIIWAIIAGIILSKISNSSSVELDSERNARKIAHSNAENELKSLITQMESEANLREARPIQSEMTALKSRFDELANSEQKAMADLPNQVHQRQLTEHLERFYIDKAKISGIGPTKQATLRSFGIETAADIQWNRIIRIRGFGEVLTRSLVDWRKEKERGFRFNPARGVTEADRRKVQQSYASTRQEIEQKMRNGLSKLQTIKSRHEAIQQRYQARLQEAFDRKAQAELDLKAL